MIEVKSTTEEKVHMHLAPQTSAGKPATIDGKINYEVTEGDATVVEEGTAKDGSAIDNANPMFVSGDTAVESKIVATADADLGEGVETIVQEFSYVASLPKAKSFNVIQDAPEAK